MVVPPAKPTRSMPGIGAAAWVADAHHVSRLTPAHAARGMLWVRPWRCWWGAEREVVGSMGGLSPALKVLPL